MSPIQYNLVVLATLLLSSLCVRWAVIFAGHQWIKTASHSVTLMILPIIAFIITSVIAGNIALSLGMVGALSIIRFRNPVKSPFELVIYFLMITAGIAAGVSLVWVLLLMVPTILIIVGAELFNRTYFQINKTRFFKTSFSEGNSLSTLEVRLGAASDALRNNRNLVHFVEGPQRSSYRFAASSEDELLAIADSVRAHDADAEVQYAAG